MVRKEEFDRNPNLFVETKIKDFAAGSAKNQLPAFNCEPIFDAPLVGFADGDDPIFQYYKVVVSDFHLTPREAWERYLQGAGAGSGQPDNLRVISFVMPITDATRRSLAAESIVPSLRWNHTRWQGHDFITELSNYVISLLGELGYHGVAPELASFFERREMPGGLVSNWSQRHIAYAAGLGTFSLSDGFITPRGIAMRCGSVVTDAPLNPSPRTYKHHLANCLFYRGESCGRCMQRCPVGAIKESGHDKIRCREFMQGRQKEILKELGREEGYMGRYVGCGFCQVKVPCEFQIPPAGSGS